MGQELADVNFSLRIETQPACGHCHRGPTYRDELICKGKKAWKICFEPNVRGFPINKFQEWLELLMDPMSQIINQSGSPIPLEVLLEAVEAHKDGGDLPGYFARQSGNWDQLSESGSHFFDNEGYYFRKRYVIGMGNDWQTWMKLGRSGGKWHFPENALRTMCGMRGPTFFIRADKIPDPGDCCQRCLAKVEAAV